MAERNFSDGVFVTMLIALVLLSVILIVFYINAEVSSEFLGSKSGPCFANHTCRNELFCLHGDGAEPGTCVKK